MSSLFNYQTTPLDLVFFLSGFMGCLCVLMLVQEIIDFYDHRKGSKK